MTCWRKVQESGGRNKGLRDEKKMIVRKTEAVAESKQANYNTLEKEKERSEMRRERERKGAAVMRK